MIEARNNMNKNLILNLVLGAVILFIAILFWPKNDTKIQSNAVDKTKTQIRVDAKRINIRSLPTIDSEDLGDVYKDEIYTVLEHVDTNEYYWYKIKTNYGVEGYIASDPNDNYVSLVSGYIDRTAPTITSKKPFLIFIDDNKNYDEVVCNDEYSTCSLSYEITDSSFITFKAQDEDGNTSSKAIRYYNVYNFNKNVNENSSFINAKYVKNKVNDKYLINASYSVNKTIKNEYKSVNYSPVINLYDENFQEIEDIIVFYNESNLPSNCINDNNLSLKDEYQDIDLLKGNTLCMNFSFVDSNSSVKYIAFGFSGVENYENVNNTLANYYSKYYILN